MGKGQSSGSHLGTFCRPPLMWQYLENFLMDTFGRMCYWHLMDMGRGHC